MIKPLWYLDVDGVLNVWPDWRDDGTPKEFRRQGVANGYTIKWDSRVADFINRVHEEGLVEIVWATTWEHLADEYIGPLLGLPSFRVTNKRRAEFSVQKMYEWIEEPEWWKYPVVSDDFLSQPEGARMIWTDDDLGYAIKSYQTVRDFLGSDPNTKLAIVPKTEQGLTMEALDQIENFLLKKEITV